MGCACGNRAARLEVLRTSRAAPTRFGGYLLATYPDCTVLHLGAFQGTSIYVVGRNTEFERLFRREDLVTASQYARDSSQSIENIPTTALCDQAVLDVYGA